MKQHLPFDVLDADLLSPVWPHSTQIEVSRGYGCCIQDTQGREYLDFTAGIGVTNTGHCHPRVVAAIQRQAENLLHGQITIVYHRPALELAKELSTILPSQLNCFFFSCSGSEAIEGALKLARHATGRTNVIAFQGGYHGRTVGAMSVTTSKTVYRERYQPLMPGVMIAPFPYAYRYGLSEGEAAQQCAKELEHILETQSAPAETAAMILEPVLGEGGYVVAPEAFLKEVRRICDKHGILLILDEIQSGFGRTGRLFACEHSQVVPDILVMAKGLASGMPLSGIAASRELMRHWLPGSHGGTYGPNAVAAAAAVETLRVIRDENLVENAAEQGAFLKSKLKDLQAHYPIIGDVRGLGLMLGCEFIHANGDLDRAVARAVRESCLQDGLLLITCGTHDQVVRWVPPLVVTRKQIELALDIFESALARVSGKQPAALRGSANGTAA